MHSKTNLNSLINICSFYFVISVFTNHNQGHCSIHSQEPIAISLSLYCAAASYGHFFSNNPIFLLFDINASYFCGFLLSLGWNQNSVMRAVKGSSVWILPSSLVPFHSYLHQPWGFFLVFTWSLLHSQEKSWCAYISFLLFLLPLLPQIWFNYFQPKDPNQHNNLMREMQPGETAGDQTRASECGW